MLINNKIINGILQEYTGKQLQILGELEVYLNQPVGVGDHPNISDSIDGLITQLSVVDDRINTIHRHFSVTEQSITAENVENQTEGK
jgi:hypothetical protein